MEYNKMENEAWFDLIMDSNTVIFQYEGKNEVCVGYSKQEKVA